MFADDFDTSSPTIESMLKPIFAFDPGIVVNVVGVGGIILFSCNEVRLIEFSFQFRGRRIVFSMETFKTVSKSTASKTKQKTPNGQ